MRGLGKIAVAMLAVLTLPITSHAMGSYSSMPAEKPVINRVIGDVTVRPTGTESWREGKEGMLLDSGDTVKTGSEAKCEIYHAGGAIRIYGNTVLVVPELLPSGDEVSIKRVIMDTGAGIFRSSPRGIEDRFEVQTLHVIAGVKGTIFSVLNDENGTTVSVFTGWVLATDTGRTPETATTLGPGSRMTVKDGKGFGTVLDFEPWDAWGGWKRDTELPSRDPRARRQGRDDGETEPDRADDSPTGRVN